MTHEPQAFFLPATAPSTGQRFCIFHPAQSEQIRGRVVYVHPFAEEMNKSRRMAAMQSRALAAAGFSVLQIDLHGCGDSSGDFGDASWDDWVNDVVEGVAWLTERDEAHARAPLWFWGLRAGCLVAIEAAAKLAQPSNFCFWQPATAGKLILQQFLRLKLAADMLDGGSKGLMDQMKQALAKGRSLEIAGYCLAPALAQGLEQAALNPPSHAAHLADGAGGDRRARLAWFELSLQAGSEASPVARQHLQNWQAAGYTAQHQLIQGPSFWQTQEIEDAPALLAATCAAFLNWAPARSPAMPA